MTAIARSARLTPALILLLLGIVLGLWAASSPAGAEESAAPSETVATTPEGEPICVACHDDVSHDVVETWRSQNHGRNGVSCPMCHNTHEQQFTPKPRAGVCFSCHDVAAIHTGTVADAPASQCMECHTANVHWLAGPSSWFYGGLSREDLAGSDEETAGVSASTGRASGIVTVAVALIFGLVVGLVTDRFVRDL